jgi:phosphatidylserine decarboxylase
MAQVLFRAPLQLSQRLTVPPNPQSIVQQRLLFNQKLTISPSPSIRFSTSRPRAQNQQESFNSRLRQAWSNTRVKWYPIPVGLGIGFLGFVQLRRIQRRAEAERQGQVDSSDAEYHDTTKPKKRKRIRPSGPWQVQVMSTLPLKALSRLWGRFNELDIPYYLRVPGFKLYSFIFGVNLSEVGEPDLHAFPNLAAFFYRELKPGLRPISDVTAGIVSPADGRVLQFGRIESGEVEQVKGMTYSVDALLGTSSKPSSRAPSISSDNDAGRTTTPSEAADDIVKSDEEFARVNGISYTLPDLFSGGDKKSAKQEETMDMSTTPRSSSEAEVRAELALGDSTAPWYSLLAGKDKTALYYCVVYLAPGDYHRFHSPAPWVVESRRHFAGELYSVSPYLQRTLPGLFTLNERVVLLGRWRWGFFSMTPVGATNVGSIKINFDRELRTNSLTVDTAADKAAEEAAERGEPYTGFVEATYEGASKLLRGHALRKGEEMGGFQLGSTIVLVFEAPNAVEGDEKATFKWNVEQGQKVKYGELLGAVEGA